MKNFKRTMKKVWQVATRCLLLIATVVAMLLVTINVAKVPVTQIRLGMIYRDIESAESARDYAAEQAQQYKGGTASYYQSQADNYDAETEYLTQNRYDIMHSDDSIVAWAAKDGFEHSIFWPSVLVMIVVIGMWWMVFKHLTVIIDAEQRVFSAVVYVLFKTLSSIFLIIGLGCLNFAQINHRKRTKRAKRTNTQQKRQSNIVKFDNKKRRLG